MALADVEEDSTEGHVIIVLGVVLWLGLVVLAVKLLKHNRRASSTDLENLVYEQELSPEYAAHLYAAYRDQVQPFDASLPPPRVEPPARRSADRRVGTFFSQRWRHVR